MPRRSRLIPRPPRSSRGYGAERFDRPLPIIAGEDYAHPVAFYSPDRPQAFLDFDFAKNLWITREDLAKRGWAAICGQTDERCLAGAGTLAGGAAERLEINASRRFLGHVAEPRPLVVFLSPPAGEVGNPHR